MSEVTSSSTSKVSRMVDVDVDVPVDGAWVGVKSRSNEALN